MTTEPASGPASQQPADTLSRVAMPALYILVAISVMQPVALNILAPATPALARTFNTSYATIQLTLSVYLATVALSQLVVGPLSDRYGRRPCVLAGTVLYVIGSLVGALADTVPELLFARALEAAGAGTAFALVRAIIRDTANKDETTHAIASVTMVMVVAPMLAPLIGGFIDQRLGWRAIFMAMSGVGLIVLAIVAARLPETAPRRGVAVSLMSVVSALPHLLSDRNFWLNVGALSATSAAFFSFVAGAPYVVIEVMGQTAEAYGLYFILNAVGYMAGNYTCRRLAMTVGSQRLISVGLWISIVGMTLACILALLPGWSPLMLFLPLCINAFGNGMTIPSATSAALAVRPDLAGSAAGIMGAVQLGSGALAAVLIGWLVTIWPPSLAVSGWLLVLFAVVANQLNSFNRNK